MKKLLSALAFLLCSYPSAFAQGCRNYCSAKISDHKKISNSLRHIEYENLQQPPYYPAGYTSKTRADSTKGSKKAIWRDTRNSKICWNSKIMKISCQFGQNKGAKR